MTDVEELKLWEENQELQSEVERLHEEIRRLRTERHDTKHELDVGYLSRIHWERGEYRVKKEPLETETERLRVESNKMREAALTNKEENEQLREENETLKSAYAEEIRGELDSLRNIAAWAKNLARDIPPGSNVWADMIREEAGDE